MKGGTQGVENTTKKMDYVMSSKLPVLGEKSLNQNYGRTPLLL